MPKYRLLTTSASLSTSNGSWIESEAQSGVFADGVTTLSLGSLRTVTFTPTRNFTLSKILFYLILIGRSGTFTITIKQGTTTISTNVYTVDQATFPYNAGPQIITLLNPVSLTSGVAYTINIQNSASGLMYAAGTTTIFYAAFPDVATNATTDKPNSTTGMVIDSGVTLSLDESISLGVDGTVSGAICCGAKIECINPTGSYAFSVTGRILVGQDSEFLIGSQSAKISPENKFRLISTYNTAKSAFFISAPANWLGVISNAGFKISLYGDSPTKFWVDVSIYTDGSQPTIQVTEDVSGHWSVGDKVKIVGYASSSIDATEYVIQSITSTHITFTTNLVYPVYKSARIVNITKSGDFGVSVENNSASRSHILFANSGILLGCDGVYFKDSSPGGHTIGYTDFNISESLLNCLVYVTRSVHISFMSYSSWNFFSKCKIINYHLVANAYTTNYLNPVYNSAELLISDSTFIGGLNSPSAISVSKNKIINTIFQTFDTVCVSINANGHEFVFARFFGGQYGWNVLSSNFSKFVDCVIENNTSNQIKIQNSSFDWYGGELGTDVLNSGNYTIGQQFNNISQCVFDGVKVGSLTMDDSTPGYSSSSYLATLDGFIRFRNINGIGNNNISWQRQGYLTTNGDSLIMTIKNPNEEFPVNFNAGTSHIDGEKIGVFINCQIENSNFYSGEHVLPKLSVAYDLDKSAYSSAIENTDVQNLGVVFSPIESFSPLSIVLSAATDAINSSNVIWDSLMVNVRKYGYTFYSYERTITEATDDTITVIPTLLNDQFISELSSVIVSTYTGFSVNHDTRTITVTENHSVEELYDWLSYNLTIDENFSVSEFFTTIDGITYNCFYDLVVDGVTLSGTGKRLYMPDNSFSAINGGGTGCIVTDISGTLVAITLQNVVVGSTWAVYRVSDGVAIVEPTIATANEVSTNYTHVNDLAVIVRVRKATTPQKFLPWSSSGIITSNGLTLIVEQIMDTVAS
jgi:hypothetical protein